MLNEARQLQHKIRASIPLSEAMQFSIIELHPRAILVQAPLEPNVNIHGTGFAGSIYSLAVLTGWALSMHIMALNHIPGELVVARAEIKYRSPLTGAIQCRTQASEEDCDAFREGFETSGKGKLVLGVDVGEAENAILQATYIALSSAPGRGNKRSA
ncbi:MAG: YiiD C-terminal domain-containing protein [Proteobacteria bacterium]|nr:YiiD C-terminal domain-containing protein [Pseudomonadota bacterium]